MPSPHQGLIFVPLVLVLGVLLVKPLRMVDVLHCLVGLSLWVGVLWVGVETHPIDAILVQCWALWGWH